jgi:hypothetical protein
MSQGSLSQADVVEDLKRSLHDAASAFSAAADADFRRHIAVALVAMQAKRPRTLLGSVSITAGEPRFALQVADFVQYKTHVWGSRPPRPWLPSYPGALPRVCAVQEGDGWALMFDPPPSAQHVATYGADFRFWYFGTHRLGLTDPAESTLAAADRPLLLLRAQAEAMRELSMRNINKGVQLRDGLSGTPRNSTPAALFQVLLAEFEAAK